MSDPTANAQLRLQILHALDEAPSGRDLAGLYLLLSRSRRDASMLPAMSALIGGGYCEKVHADHGWAVGESTHRGDPLPVRFRLTPAGRALLHPGRRPRAHSRPEPDRVPSPGLAPVV